MLKYLSLHNQDVWLQFRFFYVLQIVRMVIVSSREVKFKVIPSPIILTSIADLASIVDLAFLALEAITSISLDFDSLTFIIAVPSSIVIVEGIVAATSLVTNSSIISPFG